MVFQNLIMEGVESRKNVRKTVEQTMWKLTNKETLTMLCSVVKHAGGGLEHERSVRVNTRRSRMFLSTSWVLTLTLTSSLFFLPFTPCSRSAFVPIIPISCFSLVVSRFLLFGSLSAHHSALEKPVCGGGRYIHTCMLKCKVLSKGCEKGVICRWKICERSSFSGKNVI